MRASSLRALAALAALAAMGLAAAQYNVTVISLPTEPVLSYLDGNTAWPQSFNPSWVVASAGTSGKQGLLVRSQNCTQKPKPVPGQCVSCNVNSDWPIAPYYPGSIITFSQENPDGSFAAPYPVFQPESDAPQDETYGTEDPRIAYDESTGLYHLMYTCYGKATGPYLCHATTEDPTLPYIETNWKRFGAVFPDKPGSKSGALLFRPSPPHYLIWGAGIIALAVTNDLYNFTTVNDTFITRRDGFFDNNLVEAGPPPLPLSDGNLVFFYNSDNSTHPPDGDFWAYNPGWVILNGTDPSQILQRSSVPLLSPQFGWEQGVAPYLCNVHNVTFLEAARAVLGQPDTFDVFFGGSDTVVGTARIKVTGTAPPAGK